jgi:hypothetical protein
MGSRERKRAERRKRKQRATRRTDDHVAQMTARSEARNEAARAALEPLAAGERPLVVTVGAVISAVLVASILIGYAVGVEVTVFSDEGIPQGSDRPPLAQVLVPAVLIAVMAWGMWRARYWAVLGFQAVLVIVLVMAILGLVQATEWTQAVGTVLLIAGAGTMFWFMIKAMARIQMPERR